MRYFYLLPVAMLFTVQCQADELDRFNQLFEATVNNYEYATSTNNSSIERSYLQLLGKLSDSADQITRKLSKYTRHEEIRNINLKKYCSLLIGSFNSQRITTKTSRKRSEQDRLGALFMLYTYSNALTEYSYPDIKIPSTNSTEKYILLLEKFTNNVELIYNDESSDIIKDHVYASYRRFSRHARTLQNKGMKLGFSITKYLNYAISAINTRRLGWKSGDSQQELYGAIEQLVSFGSQLESMPVKEPVKVVRTNSSTTAHKKLMQELKEYRTVIIKEDQTIAGLSYLPETINDYVNTLSKAELKAFKRAEKRYMKKGFSEERAQTTAIKMIHSYTLANLNKIPSTELKAIVSNLPNDSDDLEKEDTDEELFYASSNAKLTRM